MTRQEKIDKAWEACKAIEDAAHARVVAVEDAALKANDVDAAWKAYDAAVDEARAALKAVMLEALDD